LAEKREVESLVEKLSGNQDLTRAERDRLVRLLMSSSVDSAGSSETMAMSREQVEHAVKQLQELASIEFERLETNKKSLEALGKKEDIIERELKYEEQKLTRLYKQLEYEARSNEVNEESLKTLAKEIKKQEKLNKKLEKRVAILQSAQGAGESMGKTFAELFGVSKSGFAGMLSEAQNTGDTFRVLGRAAKGLGKELASTLLNPTVMLASLGTKALESALSLDKLNSEMFRTTGMENVGFLIGDIGAEFRSLNLDSEELASSFADLQRGFKGFFQLNEAEQSQLATTSALMAQLGVDTGATAESMGFMMSSLGMSVKQTEETSRQLVGLANALKLPPEEIMQGFSGATNSLAKHGPQMVTEFSRLAAAGRALNMDVGQLTNVVGEQLDTFEGAANAAGNLNAMLGGPYLNSVELLGATESERVVMLKEALDLQGKSFDSMSRFERKGIASSLGMDVNQLGKFMAPMPTR